MLDHDAPRTHLWVGVRVIFLCISSIVEGFAVHKEWPLWIWLAAVGKHLPCCFLLTNLSRVLLLCYGILFAASSCVQGRSLLLAIQSHHPLLRSAVDDPPSRHTGDGKLYQVSPLGSCCSDLVFFVWSVSYR